MRGFIDASLLYRSRTLGSRSLGGLWKPEHIRLLGTVFVGLGAFIVVATTLRALWTKTVSPENKSTNRCINQCASPAAPDDSNTDFFLIVGGALTLTIALTLGLHETIGPLYPKDRTGLNLVPIFCLMAIAGISAILGSKSYARRISCIPPLIVTVAVVGQMLTQFPGTYHRTWPPDASGRAMFQSLQLLQAHQPDRPIRVVSCS